MKVTPLDDLEMFELLQAAYPGRFESDDNDTFEAAQEFADELSGWDDIAELLGRVATLTTPMRSPLTGKVTHCLGKVSMDGDTVNMLAVVKRPVKL
jgi:hypothetical protein